MVFVSSCLFLCARTTEIACSSPIITFIIILLLPSCLTFLTLLVHRIRAARTAQRDRAPESVVHNLPSEVWTGTSWENQTPANFVPADGSTAQGEVDLEQGLETADASNSQKPHRPSWVDTQSECAICLEMFVKGDCVRVLPCYHLFHIDEIDEWLLHKKKLVRPLSPLAHATPAGSYMLVNSAPSAKPMSLNRMHRRQSPTPSKCTYTRRNTRQNPPHHLPERPLHPWAPTSARLFSSRQGSRPQRHRHSPSSVKLAAACWPALAPLSSFFTTIMTYTLDPGPIRGLPPNS